MGMLDIIDWTVLKKVLENYTFHASVALEKKLLSRKFPFKKQLASLQATLMPLNPWKIRKTQQQFMILALTQLINMQRKTMRVLLHFPHGGCGKLNSVFYALTVRINVICSKSVCDRAVREI